MNHKGIVLAAIALGIACASLANAATDWSAQDYDLYPGDFDGDGKTDILYIAKDPSKSSGIATSDGAGPNASWQSWPSNHLGVQWYGGQYVAVVGDFNNDNKSDVLLQRTTAGDSYLLLADASGRLSGISQTIGYSHLGQTWSRDQHVILAGDFDGDGRDDLFFQATAPSGTHAVALAAAGGVFTNGPTQTFTDTSWSAFKWSTKNSVINVGDFNGDGRADLLIQAKPNIVMIDYDVPIPVPVYTPNSFGVVYSQGGTTPLQQVGIQQWSRNYNGVDWSPNSSTVIIGDFNGDGRTDVLLQARSAGRPSYLLYGNASGAGFSAATAATSNVPVTADGARLIAGNFAGGSGARLYVQATVPSGTNYTATLVGGSISASTHNPTSITGIRPTTAVGVTPGSFDVDRLGAAVYRIPIQVPPGIKGVQPNLALTYSSQAGNGLLGIGWGLSGLSQIALCPATVVQDGYSISYTDDDEGQLLCLDGTKLHQTNAESFGEYPYFQAGATYETERMSFIRIVNHGTISDPSAHLTAYRNDGLEYEYGGTVDSRIVPLGKSEPNAWLLSRVKDRAGNVMAFEYENDGQPNGSFRPKRILYTANANAAVAPAYELKFVWESRPASDHVVQFWNGSRVRETKRLDRIETYYNGAMIRKYELSYAQSSTQRSRLISVQECSGSGACLGPTVLTWQDGVTSWAGEQTISHSLPYTSTPELNTSTAVSVRSLDYDGDGLSDLIYARAPVTAPNGYTSTPWAVFKSNGSTLTTPYVFGSTYDTGNPLGRVLLYGSSSSPITGAPATPVKWTGDVNGDGLADMMYFNGQFRVKRGERGNFYTGYDIYVDEPVSVSGVVSADQLQGGAIASDSGFLDPYMKQLQTQLAQVPDFNGDGKTDFLIQRSVTAAFGSNGSITWRLSAALLSNDAGYQMVALSSKYFCSATGLVPPCAEAGAIAPPVDVGVLATDFNGDGFTDILNKDLRTNQWQIFWGTSLGLSNAEYVDLPTTLPNVVAQDFTDDGRVDLLYSDVANSVQTWKLLRWTGVKFESAQNNAVPDGAQQLRLMDINGDSLIDVGYLRDGAYRIRIHEGQQFDLLRSITDGFQNEVAITYARSFPFDSSVYTAGAARLPNINDQDVEVQIAPRQAIVKSHRLTDGAGGYYTISQRYTGARTGNRGFLGYEFREESDSRTGLVRHTDYVRRIWWQWPDLAVDLSFPHTGLPNRTWLTQSDGTLVNETYYKYVKLEAGIGIADVIQDDSSAHWYPSAQNGGFSYRVHVYANEVIARSYEVGGVRNGALLSETRTTVNVMDAFGNATDVTTVVEDKDILLPTTQRTFTTRVVKAINNDTANWCLGRPHRTDTTYTLASGGSRTQRSAKTIDYVKCRVTDEVAQPDTPSQSVVTHYEFAPNACGNASSASLTGYRNNGTALPVRTTRFDYGPKCLAAEAVTDAMGQPTVRTFNYALGVVETERDPNNRLTRFEYDSLGRRSKTILSDNTSTTVSLSPCNVSNSYCGVSDLRIRITTSNLDADGVVINSSYKYVDSLGRSRIADTSLPLGGGLSHVVSTYDQLGKLVTRSVPYAGVYQGNTVYGYDILGRQTSAKLYNASGMLVRQTSARYEGRRNVSVNPRGHESAKVFDVSGQVRTVKDPTSSLLTHYDYAFNGTDLVSTIVDKAGNELRTTSDIIGRKVRSEDPDMGTWTFEYTSFGELTKQTDAKNQVTSYDDYDLLGRPTVRREVEGNTYFTYGTPAQYAYGQLKSVTGGGYTETYDFDTLGRPSATHIQIPGEPQYDINYGYDFRTGRLDTMTYPASAQGTRVKIKYGYTQGLQTSIRDYTNNTLGATYWQATAINAMAQTTNEQLGNGLRVVTGYDPTTGLMTSRQSGTDGGSTNRQNMSYLWDANGNLERRTDRNQDMTQGGLFEHFYYDTLNRLDYSTRNGVQNLNVDYDELGNITNKSDVGGYNYTTAQAGCTYYAHSQPHAVRNANGSYCYDANGNMVSRPSASVTWNSKNMVTKITQGALSSEFWYTPVGGRYKQHAVYAGGSETTVYVGGVLEKVTLANGNIAYRHYISGGTSTVIHTRWSTGAVQTVYATTDNLGSNSTVTSESGDLLVNESFDAFGKRRASNWTSNPPSVTDMQAIANSTRKGYTGHEHMDNLGLINMNGRVQDPVLGRFLSADPMIQAPEFGQSLNRYTYVWNNPLRMSDPSGFEGCVPYGKRTDGDANLCSWACSMSVDCTSINLHPEDAANQHEREYNAYVYFMKTFFQGAAATMKELQIWHVVAGKNGQFRETHQKDVVDTEYAAINGQSNDLAKAVKLMGDHIQRAYGTGVKEFTLVWNPNHGMARDSFESLRDKLGLTTKVATEFANILMETNFKGTKVSWVAHSQGGIIFVEAARISNGQLNQMTVAFHGGANNIGVTNKIMDAHGVTNIGYLNRPDDLVPNIVGFNGGLSEIFQSLGQVHNVFFGTRESSPHTLPCYSCEYSH